MDADGRLGVVVALAVSGTKLNPIPRPSRTVGPSTSVGQLPAGL
ncbi:MAG TPA: hypothetical protein VFA45_15355 [Actinomycetes bacterium]|nr:hypothetical protein [Actinomycetes bacterium]